MLLEDGPGVQQGARRRLRSASSRHPGKMEAKLAELDGKLAIGRHGRLSSCREERAMKTLFVVKIAILLVFTTLYQWTSIVNFHLIVNKGKIFWHGSCQCHAGKKSDPINKGARP